MNIQKGKVYRSTGTGAIVVALEDITEIQGVFSGTVVDTGELKGLYSLYEIVDDLLVDHFVEVRI
jgi:hypothetical protein